MATPAEIVDAAETTAVEGVLSSSVDGRSATAMDPLKMLDVADRLQSRELLAGTNANGGSRSGWGMMRPARAIPPSASGRSVGDE
jgi:methylmalonyl-CoA mutase cobalamin-binding subunit